MRTNLIILTAILAFCFSANAENVIKDYDLTFNGIEVYNNFEILLIKSEQHSVTVEVPADYAPYLSVTTEAGILKVRFKKLPVKMQINKERFKLTVRTPMINFIDLSGACNLTCNDEFSLGMNNFRATLSGASSISTMKLNSVDASFRLSGASKLNFSGEFSDLEILAEGASEINFKGDCSEMQASITSSSKFNATGKIDRIDLDEKGASRVTLLGEGAALNASLAGASRLKADEFPVKSAKIDAKGASNVTLDASESIKADISGASTCKYRNRPDLRTNPMVSGGGKFQIL